MTPALRVVHLCRALEACRVLVTGANGYVGRSLLERFAELGADVQGVDLVADPQRGVVAGDITEPGPWCSLLQDRQLVVHAAGVHHGAPDAAQAWHVNVVGTRRLLDAAADHDVPRFVHLSSTGVACFAQAAPDIVDRCNPGQELDEHWPLMPVGEPCADSAMAAEHAVLAAHAGGEVSATVIRAADVYGPGNRPWVLEPLEAIRSGRFVLPEDEQGLFTIVYIDDLVAGVIAAATSPAAEGQIFHLGGEEPVTSGEYFGHLAAMLGRPERLASAQDRCAAGPASALDASLDVALAGGAKTRPVCNAKARVVLGWWPHVELEEGMARTEAWLRAHGHLPALAV